MDQFTAVAAAILAERAGLSPEDPEPQITATALLGLWRIQFQALSRYLDGTRTPAQVHQAVTADVRRAAQLINTGLNSLTASTPGPDRHQDTTATEHAPRLTVRFARAGWFSGSGGFRRGRRCFRRRGWGWCEPGRGDVCHHDRHDHQRHDGHAV